MKFILVCSVLAFAEALTWNVGGHGAMWRMNCDFVGNDLGHVVVEGNKCSDVCYNTPGCSFFTWNPNWEGKPRCWLKSSFGGTRTQVETKMASCNNCGTVCGGWFFDL